MSKKRRARETTLSGFVEPVRCPQGFDPTAEFDIRATGITGIRGCLRPNHYLWMKNLKMSDDAIFTMKAHSLSSVSNRDDYEKHYGLRGQCKDGDAIMVRLFQIVPEPEMEYGELYSHTPTSHLRYKPEVMGFGDQFLFNGRGMPFRSTISNAGPQFDFMSHAKGMYWFGTGSFGFGGNPIIRVLLTQDPFSMAVTRTMGEASLHMNGVVASREYLERMLIPTGFLGSVTPFKFYLVLNANYPENPGFYGTMRILLELLKRSDKRKPKPNVEIVQLSPLAKGKMTTLADVLASGVSLNEVLAQARPVGNQLDELGREVGQPISGISQP